MMKLIKQYFYFAVILFFTIILATCGSSGGGDSNNSEPSEPSGPQEINSEDVTPMYRKSAVFILAEVGFGQSSGTGIVLDTEGNILTNNHVIDGAATVEVRIPDTNDFVDAYIVGRSPCDDLAIIKVNRKASEFDPAIIGDSSELVQGATVFAVGYPFDPSNQEFNETSIAVTEGLISRLNENFSFYGLRNCIQISAPLNHGNSGGPLINKYGEVIGVNTLGFASMDVENINYAIAINEAMIVCETLLNEIDVDYVGVDLAPNDPYFLNNYNIPYFNNSSVIISVTPYFHFDESNWYPGDVILTAAGSPVANMGDLCSVLRSHKSGDMIEIYGVGKFPDDNGGYYYDYYSSDLIVP